VEDKVNLEEFVWHKHDETDDLFVVLRGHLTVQLRDRGDARGDLTAGPVKL